MGTPTMIRVTIILTWVIIACAGFGVGKFYDLVVNGWMALAALLGIMIGGKTWERVQELTANSAQPSAVNVQGDASVNVEGK